MTISHDCDACGATVVGADLGAFGDAYVGHVRSAHADWPYPDLDVRNYAEATQRLTGSTERLVSIGPVAVHRVSEDRLDDWLDFFDHDGFAGNLAWAACYCTEPHLLERGTPPEEAEARSWRENRRTMVDLLRAGTSFGYLAYVDGRPAGWVNASTRSAYALYRRGPDAEPADDEVVAVSCFVIAPPYRRHGLAAALLERVLADAAGRGAAWVEAYPAPGDRADDAGNFRGPRALFDAHGFEPVDEQDRPDRHTVVRRRP